MTSREVRRSPDVGGPTRLAFPRPWPHSGGTPLRRPMLAVVLALVAGLGVLVAPSSPAVAADEVTVTWPSVTAFNPDTTTYEVTVDDPVGTGVLMAWWRDEPGQVIDGQGTTALTFGATGVGSVLITRCPASSASYPSQCWGVGQSGELSVYDRLIVGPTTSVVSVPGPARTAVTWSRPRLSPR